MRLTVTGTSGNSQKESMDLMNIRGGDIIAFGGTGFLSGAIDFFTGSKISHLAMVINPALQVDGKPQSGLNVVESTILNGRNGVQINPLTARLADYLAPGGRAWVLRLSERVRAFLDWDNVWAFAMERVGRDRYNVLELGAYVMRDLPAIGQLPFWYMPNSHEEVCSELVTELLAAGGIPGLKPYQSPPQVVAELKIFAGSEQLLGKPATIRNFNTK